MEKHKKILNIDDLKAGMITTKDIISENRLLLGKGMPITENIIDKLKHTYFYNKIEIYEDNTDDEKIKAMEKVEKNFIELSLDVQNIFNTMEYLQASNMEEIRIFSKRIHDELESTGLIIKNIVLYGSGLDTIYRHSVNVAALSTILGKWIGLNNKELNLLTYSAILHDFGKIKINKDILDKPNILTQKEFSIIKQHPVIGYNYLKQIKFINNSVSLGVLMHHEKIDGSGYPLGIQGDKIHKFAKIIAIADIFDAVNSDRIYKKSKKPFEALALLQEESLGKLDYEYCTIFLNHIVNYYIGENVLLNNGSLCKIVQIDVNNIEKPLLMYDNLFIDLKKEKELYIDKFIF